jgi:hypothetical protein
MDALLSKNRFSALSSHGTSGNQNPPTLNRETSAVSGAASGGKIVKIRLDVVINPRILLSITTTTKVKKSGTAVTRLNGKTLLRITPTRRVHESR